MRAVAVAAAAPAVLPTPSTRAFVLATLGLATAMLLATPADAQLGKLRKLGSEIAKEAAREAAGVPAAPVSPASGSRARADFTITAERLDLVLTALAPLAEQAKREQAAQAVAAESGRRRKAWEACATRASQAMVTMSEAYFEQGGALTSRSAALLQRYAAAMGASRAREAAYLQDTMSVLAVETSLLMSGAKCGPSVYTPSAVIEAQVARETTRTGDVTESGERQYEVPEAARKGLTTHQFGMLRERTAGYAIALLDPAQPVGRFTPEERAALDARAAELKTLAPFFKDGLIRWTSWGDVKGW